MKKSLMKLFHLSSTVVCQADNWLNDHLLVPSQTLWLGGRPHLTLTVEWLVVRLSSSSYFFLRRLRGSHCPSLIVQYWLCWCFIIPTLLFNLFRPLHLTILIHFSQSPPHPLFLLPTSLHLIYGSLAHIALSGKRITRPKPLYKWVWK